jgi:uncharacterized phage protein gp47/JayE
VLPDGVLACQDACTTWAEPIGFKVTVTSAVAVTVNIDAIVYGDDLPSTLEEDTKNALAKLFESLPIAIDNSSLATSLFVAEIHALVPMPSLRKVVIVSPAADVALTAGQVPVLGTVSIVAA